MRILIAAILGALVMFIWGFVSHVLTPLGEMGLKQLPNEQPVMAAMQENITEHGMYFFPGIQMNPKPSDEEQKAWEAKYKAGPIGIIVYSPHGNEAMSPKLLAIEFGTTFCAVLLAAFIVSNVRGYGKRVFCFMLIGLIGWFSISASYWNWFAFPTDHTISQLIGETVGWLLAGIFAAAIAKPRVTPEPAV